jgi:hypothetical protein
MQRTHECPINAVTEECGVLSMTKKHSANIFGYGALMSLANRGVTLRSTVNGVPVIAKGLERYWGFAAQEYGLTSLALRVKPGTYCSGVLFPVTTQQEMYLTSREQGYGLVELPLAWFGVLQPANAVTDGPVYAYTSEDVRRPSRMLPITQSEIDVIMTGCLEDYRMIDGGRFGEEFARQFVRTTSGWESPWIDDRGKPRYPWPLDRAELASEIDAMLREEMPLAFGRRAVRRR